MTMESALGAPGERNAGHPTGYRRLTPGLLKVDCAAESSAGLPDGVTMQGQSLRNAADPYRRDRAGRGGAGAMR